MYGTLECYSRDAQHYHCCLCWLECWFLILAAIPAAGYAYAVVALAVFWFCVPETKTGVNRKASHQKHLAKS